MLPINFFEDLDIWGLISFSHNLVYEWDHEDSEEYRPESRDTHLDAGTDSS